MQAWLEAYHQATSGKKGVLDAGDMSGRAGAIQVSDGPNPLHDQVESLVSPLLVSMSRLTQNLSEI